jgi:hypothetical protein
MDRSCIASFWQLCSWSITSFFTSMLYQYHVHPCPTLFQASSASIATESHRREYAESQQQSYDGVPIIISRCRNPRTRQQSWPSSSLTVKLLYTPPPAFTFMFPLVKLLYSPAPTFLPTSSAAITAESATTPRPPDHDILLWHSCLNIMVPNQRPFFLTSDTTITLSHS